MFRYLHLIMCRKLLDLSIKLRLPARHLSAQQEAFTDRGNPIRLKVRRTVSFRTFRCYTSFQSLVKQ